MEIRKLKAGLPDSVLLPQEATWPKLLADSVKAIETALHSAGNPVAPEELAKTFVRAKSAGVAEILQTLATLGRVRKQGKQFMR